MNPGPTRGRWFVDDAPRATTQFLLVLLVLLVLPCLRRDTTCHI